MTTTHFTEGRYTAEFLISESEQPNYSREVVTIAPGQNLGPGTVLGRITTGTSATAAAFAGNTGNGAMGAITVSAGAQHGDYKLVIVESATNAGTFELEGPDGKLVGTCVVGSAFLRDDLAFTLADGATDFVSGDGFTITVAAGSGKYAQFNQDAADGRQHPAGILYAAVDASGGDAPAAAIVRDAIVNADLLVWPSDIETGEKTAAIAELTVLGILVR